MQDLTQLLRHPQFRRLWIGQSASAIGDGIVVVALALFVVEQTGSARDLSIVLTAHVAPLVAFLLIGGVWADRLPRHRIMIATDVARLALHALLAVLILAGEAEIWRVVVIEALYGVAEAFFRPAYTGLIPQTVPEELIQPANALCQVTNNVAGFLGPALATVLVVSIGPGPAFAVDAATFLVSAAFLVRLRPRSRGEQAPRESLLRELAAGFAEVRSRAWVWVTIVVFSFELLVAYAPYTVLGPLIARDRYGDAAFFGVLVTAMGLGTVAGSVLAVRWRPERPLRTGFIAIGAWPVMLVSFALGAPFATVLVAAGAAGTGIGLYLVWWETALAERIPPAALSRVTSYDWMGSLALVPIGYLLAGAIGQAVEPTTVLAVGGVLSATLLTLGLLPRQTRALRRIERGVEPAPGAAAERPFSGVT